MSLDDQDRPTDRDVTDSRSAMAAMADRSEKTGQRSQTASRWMLLSAFVLFVAGLGNVIVIDNVGNNVESNRATAEETQNQIRELQRAVNRLEDFVDKLETSTPEEQALNAAISRAVAEVPEIKSILCEEFPAALACQD